MSAGDLSTYGEWLVQEVSGCTCQGSDARYGHQPGCGYEPLLKVDEVLEALKAAGYAVVKLPTQQIIPTGWGDDCLGAWPAGGPLDSPVSAWPSGVALPEGDFIAVTEARLLAAALIAAADLTEANA